MAKCIVSHPNDAARPRWRLRNGTAARQVAVAARSLARKKNLTQVTAIVVRASWAVPTLSRRFDNAQQAVAHSCCGCLPDGRIPARFFAADERSQTPMHAVRGFMPQ